MERSVQAAGKKRKVVEEYDEDESEAKSYVSIAKEITIESSIRERLQDHQEKGQQRAKLLQARSATRNLKVGLQPVKCYSFENLLLKEKKSEEKLAVIRQMKDQK